MTPLEAALDAIDRAVSADCDSIIAAKCRALMVGYDAKWRDQPWETVSVEEVWHLPIINPETGHPKRTFTQAGKYDGIIRRKGSGNLYLLEHKSTSDDISDPTGLYWQILAVDSQVSAYMLAAIQQGKQLNGTLYDVMKKPGTNPKQIAKGDERKKRKGDDGKLVEITPEERHANNFGTIEEIKANQSYFGTAVYWPEGLEAGQIETPELYEARLKYEVLSKLDYYFARKYVPRLESDILEYASELVAMADAIMHARSENAHYRNSSACRQYGTPCEYLGICSGYDTPDSERWTKADEVHSELVQLDSIGGRSVLTNSRLKTFQTCRKKHWLRYEQGVRKADREEKEALVFGTVWHSALEAWFLEFKAKEGEDVNGTSSEIAAGSSQKELAF